MKAPPTVLKAASPPGSVVGWWADTGSDLHEAVRAGEGTHLLRPPGARQSLASTA
ncbi:MAG: hypothetical protein IH629_00260 [Thermoleophilia bacterium]|nr:hypothetical protein [Thermoleophilia bacterium]